MTRKNQIAFGRSTRDLILLSDSYRKKNLRKEMVVDALHDLYQNYQERINDRSIDLPFEPNNQILFKQFRTKCKGKLNDKQEHFLSDLLDGQKGGMFVPLVLNVIDVFSLQLMEKLLAAALMCADLNAMKSFLKPALRVFDLKVDLDLQNRFSTASVQQKKDILRAFEWIEASRYKKCAINSAHSPRDLKFSWSGSAFERNVRMNKEDYESYCKSIERVKAQKIDLLVKEGFLHK